MKNLIIAAALLLAANANASTVEESLLESEPDARELICAAATTYATMWAEDAAGGVTTETTLISATSLYYAKGHSAVDLEAFVRDMGKRVQDGSWTTETVWEIAQVCSVKLIEGWE